MVSWLRTSVPPEHLSLVAFLVQEEFLIFRWRILVRDETLTTGVTGVPDLLVANPFHSERVKAEVALRRSRPTTLDRDAKRLEMGATGVPMVAEVQQDAVLEPEPGSFPKCRGRGNGAQSGPCRGCLG